jgi:hypothetical protein
MVSVGFKEILYDKCGQRAVEVAPPTINMTAVIQNWVHKLLRAYFRYLQ